MITRRGAIVGVVTLVGTYLHSLRVQPLSARVLDYQDKTIVDSKELYTWQQPQPLTLRFELGQFKDFQFVLGDRVVTLTPSQVMDALEGKNG